MPIATIRYLDTTRTVTVEVPLEGLQVGWGDRRSTPDASGPLAVWTATHELVRRGTELLLRRRAPDGCLYDDDEDVATWTLLVLSQYLVAEAADAAERSDPEIAEAVARYAQIIRQIDAKYSAHERRWERDRVAIAKAFRRRTVEVGEQTVPGKVCVRSSRGTLLGYADCWDGAWLGTVERI